MSIESLHEALKVESALGMIRASQEAEKLIKQSYLSNSEKQDAVKHCKAVVSILTMHIVVTLGTLSSHESGIRHMQKILKCMHNASDFMSIGVEQMSMEVKRCCVRYISKDNRDFDDSAHNYVVTLSELKQSLSGQENLYEDVIDAIFSKEAVRGGYTRVFATVLGALVLSGTIAVVGTKSATALKTAEKAARRAEETYALASKGSIDSQTKLHELGEAVALLGKVAGKGEPHWLDKAEKGTRALFTLAQTVSSVVMTYYNIVANSK
jgi:hypothetical protein